MTKRVISRRDFLKLGSAGLLSLLIGPLRIAAARSAPNGLVQLGRVAYRTVTAYDRPSIGGNKLGMFNRDYLLLIVEHIYGEDESAYNRQWYRLNDSSFVYSGGIQPVSTSYQDPQLDIPSLGVPAQVTIPFIDSFWKADAKSRRAYRLYFDTTHWVRDVVINKNHGSIWYRLYDDRLRASYYAPANSLRIITENEIAPLSPDIPDNYKHIEVDLSTQQVTAFEDGQPVFRAPASTGRKHFETPTGWFKTFHKRVTVRMTGGANYASMYNLTGVPYATYITDNGIAFHGTYWHNDFGGPSSHGCINLSNQDARWIFRWTIPSLPHDKRWLYRPGQGTAVRVYYST